MITFRLNAIHEKFFLKNTPNLIDYWFHDQTTLHLYSEDKNSVKKQKEFLRLQMIWIDRNENNNNNHFFC